MSEPNLVDGKLVDGKTSTAQPLDTLSGKVVFPEDIQKTLSWLRFNSPDEDKIVTIINFLHDLTADLTSERKKNESLAIELASLRKQARWEEAAAALARELDEICGDRTLSAAEWMLWAEDFTQVQSDPVPTKAETPF